MQYRVKPVLARAKSVIFVAACSVLVACGPNVYDSLELMPSPTLYSAAGFDPFPTQKEERLAASSPLFYATDRQPSGPKDPQAYYNNERGHALRAGVADVSLYPQLQSWEEARRITLLGKRDKKYTLRVNAVAETGFLPFSLTSLMPDPPPQEQKQAEGRHFAKQINAQLAKSANKDVFIYVHGYNVDFNYSTLVSKELQHFLGYQGAFVSYNWAATPSRLAYFKDQETAMATRRNLREFISFLSENTRADRIHLIGYSAGSRLAFETAYQIALQPGPGPRLGELVLISSDLDRSFFVQSLEDGLLDAVEDVTLYLSQSDQALALSKIVFGRERLGQAFDENSLWPALRTKLVAEERLHIIDVTDAEQASAGNGHRYFQASPWASSDLFLSLLTDKGPKARNLVRAPGSAVWHFPPDYPARLKASVKVP